MGNGKVLFVLRLPQSIGTKIQRLPQLSDAPCIRALYLSQIWNWTGILLGKWSRHGYGWAQVKFLVLTRGSLLHEVAAAVAETQKRVTELVGCAEY